MTDMALSLGSVPPKDLFQQCFDLGSQYGAPGVDCFGDAMNYGVRLAKQGGGANSGKLLAQIMTDRLNTCLSDLR